MLTEAPKTTKVCGILPSKWVPSQIIVEDLRDLIIRSSVSEPWHGVLSNE